MPPALNTQRFRRIVSALLLLAVLALAVGSMKNLLQRGGTVADAERHQKQARANLLKAMRVLNSADRLAQRAGSTNSPPAQTVKSVGQGIIQKLQREDVAASIELLEAKRFAAADHCVQRYNGWNQAQEAMAALYLSGIDVAVIRRPGSAGSERDQSMYELLVPHSLGSQANAALQSVQIRELTRFRDPFSGIKAMQKLWKQGIRATVCTIKPQGKEDAPEEAHVLYVQLGDEDTARSLLDGSAGFNGNKL